MTLERETAVQGLCPACLLRMALAVDSAQPRFTIVTVLGEGSHGTTFLARESSGRDDHVALTVLRARGDEPSILARFDHARSALLTLRHPNIGRIVDIGCDDDGRVYVATEFVPGTPFPTAGAGSLPRDERIAIGRQLCDAVQAAHAAGVLHLALRPSKVRLTRLDDRRIVKILDFGLAAVIDDALGTTADDLDALARLLETLGVK